MGYLEHLCDCLESSRAKVQKSVHPSEDTAVFPELGSFQQPSHVTKWAGLPTVQHWTGPSCHTTGLLVFRMQNPELITNPSSISDQLLYLARMTSHRQSLGKATLRRSLSCLLAGSGRL